MLGTGGVSIAALQIAKMMGAAVIATSSSDEKLERVRTLGADHVINYRQVPDWGKRVRDLTGCGVDHVVEVGGPGTLAQSIEAVRVGGQISLVGMLTGLQGEVSTVALMAKQARFELGVAPLPYYDDAGVVSRALPASGPAVWVQRQSVGVTNFFAFVATRAAQARREREILEEELEAIWRGDKTALDALDTYSGKVKAALP